MKTTKQKKQVLDNAMLEEEFFEDTLLIGIVSALASFRFIWQVNQSLGFHFTRNHEYEIELNEIFFEVYTDDEKEILVEHFIYTNRKKTSFLLEEAKNIDFIWMLKGSHLPQRYTYELPNILNQVKGIDHSFIIQPANLKSKQHLIL